MEKHREKHSVSLSVKILCNSPILAKDCVYKLIATTKEKTVKTETVILHALAVASYSYHYESL